MIDNLRRILTPDNGDEIAEPEPCLCNGRGCINCDDEIYYAAEELLHEERVERRRYFSQGYEAGRNDAS